MIIQDVLNLLEIFLDNPLTMLDVFSQWEGDRRWQETGFNNSTGWAPKIVKLPYKWLNSMVYGRYNYSFHVTF